MVVTGTLDIHPKIDMAIELADHKKLIPDIRAKLQSVKNSAGKPNGFISKRNVIVHGIFSSRDGDPTVLVECHKKTLRGRQEIKVSYCEETHKEIIAASQVLSSLTETARINVH